MSKTPARLAHLPRGLIAFARSECRGDWDRVVLEPDGTLTILNRAPGTPGGPEGPEPDPGPGVNPGADRSGAEGPTGDRQGPAEASFGACPECGASHRPGTLVGLTGMNRRCAERYERRQQREERHEVLRRAREVEAVRVVEDRHIGQAPSDWPPRIKQTLTAEELEEKRQRRADLARERSRMLEQTPERPRVEIPADLQERIQRRQGSLRPAVPRAETRQWEGTPSGVTVASLVREVAPAWAAPAEDSAVAQAVEGGSAMAVLHALGFYTEEAGLDSCVPLEFHSDVLALHGVDLEMAEHAVRRPERMEIDPRTKDKGYPVLRFHRGDVMVVVGFRDPHHPMALGYYVTSRLDSDTHRVNHTGGGGSRRRQGQPKTVSQLIRRLQDEGAQVVGDVTDDVREVIYRDQSLGRITTKVGTAAKEVGSDWNRMQRKMNAIDERE